jgi:hypothetical protein
MRRIVRLLDYRQKERRRRDEDKEERRIGKRDLPSTEDADEKYSFVS